jgi:hypothetical protein
MNLDSSEYEIFSTAKLVGISAKEIRKHLSSWGFIVKKSDSGEILIPKAGVIKLIKLIDSEPCWACYNQLWEDAHELDRLKPELAKKDFEIAGLKRQIESLRK